MNIKGIKGIEDTLLDYPGKPAVIVYFHGCSFRCGFCHNVGLVLRDDDPDIPWKNALEAIKDRINLIEAVVASGGEATLNPGLPGFLHMMKEMELLTKLDTNGSRPGVIKKLLGEKLLDYIAMDVKHVLEPEKYAMAAGCDAKASFSGRLRANKRMAESFNVKVIEESMEIIKESGIDYEFRTTVVSGMHERADILNIARYLEGSKRYTLQNFASREEHISPDFVGREGFPADELKEIAEECSKFVPMAIRGLSK